MDHLIKELNQTFNNNIQDMIPVFKKHNLEYLKSIEFDTDETKCYQRKLLYQNDNYEIILIKWKKKSECQIHDHSENGCLLKVLDGEIKEYLYDQELNLINENKYQKDDINYIDNKIGFHKIKNLHLENTYSIHLYSPPNHKINYFKNNIL